VEPHLVVRIKRMSTACLDLQSLFEPTTHTTTPPTPPFHVLLLFHFICPPLCYGMGLRPHPHFSSVFVVVDWHDGVVVSEGSAAAAEKAGRMLRFGNEEMYYLARYFSRLILYPLTTAHVPPFLFRGSGHGVATSLWSLTLRKRDMVGLYRLPRFE